MADSEPPSSSSTSSGANLSSPSQSSGSPSRWISNFDQANFIESLPARIRLLYGREINKLFIDYADSFIYPPEFELGILSLIKDVPAALEAFKKLLPTANLIPLLSKKGRTFFIREFCTFNDRVRAGLYDDTNNYMLWLKNLIDYINGVESFQEFRRKVEPHFENMAELWMEFDAKFAPAGDSERSNSTSDDVEESNQDSTSGGTPSDYSDPKPASKRSKTE